MHRTTPRFWTYFGQLPESAQRAARRNFRLLTENPRHPSLRFKKVGKFWSVRVGVDYRALAVDDAGDFIWVWIGTHSDYDRLISP
ncbi:MAG: hypothetical protein F4Z06_04415 [Acidimicrobiia bacterium]|nr:hypothetical protein [Acidimicrobiia bacterium]MYE74026.1 hypothetical protein [Acidimicrobiia bacterium]MYJ62795.1 hypothetical protein [Acidimicrobiia bacterium]